MAERELLQPHHLQMQVIYSSLEYTFNQVAWLLHWWTYMQHSNVMTFANSLRSPAYIKYGNYLKLPWGILVRDAEISTSLCQHILTWKQEKNWRKYFYLFWSNYWFFLKKITFDPFRKISFRDKYHGNYIFIRD